MNSTKLPEALSPCANIRRSCYNLMKDPICFQSTIDEEQLGTSTSDGICTDTDTDTKGVRSVTINPDALNDLAKKVSQSIIEKNIQNKTPNSTNGYATSNHDGAYDNNSKNIDSENVDDCIDNLNFASWDADNWHYTGVNYKRSHLSKEQEDTQRFERVALYVMVLDCINFCFWPTTDCDDDATCHNEIFKNSSKSKTNLLEYEHLASALKHLAEGDDVLPEQENNNENRKKNEYDITSNGSEKGDSFVTKAENTYALAPQNLVKLDINTFRNMIQSRLPKDDIICSNDGRFSIPNSNERTRLIIEMTQAILSFHSGSATNLISKANKSADLLVHLILQNFPGFRDTAVDHNGRWVAFYKRAQILVADLWAALGKEQLEEQKQLVLDLCCFHDMEKITTFADYRVPQLLRHLGILQYSPQLSLQVDNKVELLPFSADELYIRAATIVAVDELVQLVKIKLSQEKSSMEDSALKVELWNDVNAVKMDWYLWNIGEKLDRNQSLGNHHLVRTIFY
mmetsp:Transcript_15311/g.18630  ORF Transcript_15311/g.18630 Transcript_15311/m.18630 type:complete len:513 (-) Transcript_15311:30-1568(-)